MKVKMIMDEGKNDMRAMALDIAWEILVDYIKKMRILTVIDFQRYISIDTLEVICNYDPITIVASIILIQSCYFDDTSEFAVLMAIEDLRDNYWLLLSDEYWDNAADIYNSHESIPYTIGYFNIKEQKVDIRTVRC